MNEQIIQIIREILRRFGKEILDDPKRFNSALQDLCRGEYEVEQNVLLMALKKNIPNRLLTQSAGLPIEYYIDQQSLVLNNSYGLDKEIARGAVEYWAIALGLLKAPLSRPQGIVQPSRVETPAPPPRPVRIASNLDILLSPGVEMQFMRVPAGEFLMGSDKKIDSEAYDNELPQHNIYLDEYLIGKYTVTVAQFTAFIKVSGYKTTAEKEGSGYTYTGSEWKDVKGADWQHPRGPGSDVRQKIAHPVTLVSWDDALAFCAWVSQVTGRAVRLPSEAEWEKAARGTDGRIYPWGSQAADKTLCNFNMNVQDTTPVGQYSPQGDSPYGCADMAGNVWEWTNSLWKGYPYQAGDGREESGSRDARVRRGGSFDFPYRFTRCAYRYNYYPNVRYANNGFRVCASLISFL